MEKLKEEAVNGKITLKVWCASDDSEIEKSLISSFVNEYSADGVIINVDVKSSVGEDAAAGKLIESPIDGADVFSFEDDHLSDLVNSGAVSKVAPFFRNAVKNSTTDYAFNSASKNGELYAFPKTSDNCYIMYYDKRVFTEAQVGSFDEMIKTANAAKKSVYLNMNNLWYTTSFFFTAGCKIEYDGNTKIAEFNNEKGLSAAKAMCHICEKDGKGFAGDPGTKGDNSFVAEGFKSGTLCAAVAGTWVAPELKEAIGEDNLGAVKLPTVLMDGKQQQLHSFGGCKLVGVNVYSKTPFASQLLAYYLTNSDSQIKRYEAKEYIPTDMKALEGKTSNGKTVSDDPAVKAIKDQTAYAHSQSETVSDKFWASTFPQLGASILQNKGKLDDATLQGMLKEITEQISG